MARRHHDRLVTRRDPRLRVCRLGQTTAYRRLQHRRSTFDEVAALSVEGVGKSAIARVKGIGWNTVDRWLERAASYCRKFIDTNVKELDIAEIQADEIRTFAGGKNDVVWVFATLDVTTGASPTDSAAYSFAS